MRVLAGVAAVLCLYAAGPESALWSLRPITTPAPPAVGDSAWPRNPIDSFILAKLERENIAPSPEADRATLLRRITLDLTGLPPTPAEIQSFLADRKPDAWDRVIDRLLASPHYGERWARFWLDQARYGDSDGYRGDAFRPDAWRWRDWVIQALQRDMPFDQFTIEQLAGDLLPGGSVEQQVATGFHRNTLTNREGGIDPEQFRVEAVLDRTNTFGTVWLGLTVGCAQCHDHKYDPIPQRDYYRLLAFFNTAEEWTVEAPLPGQRGPRLATLPSFDRVRRELLAKNSVADRQQEWERRMLEAAANPGKWLEWDHAFDDLRTSLSDGEKILRTTAERRTGWQQKALTDYFVANYNRAIDKQTAGELQYDKLRKELAQLDATLPPLAQAMVIREETPRRTTRIFSRGDYRSPGEEVAPGTLGVLHKLGAATPATRLDLARWVVSPENPLTARVMANRIWQQYFGRGLVKTSENFGSQGEPPSHPELLDWLASEFMASGWRMKHLHRLIATSATYRQASLARPELQERDPENRLLARQARLRLPAEFLRDSALSAAGLLDISIGGPGAPAGYRRGLYLHVLRNKPQPFLANFDAPNGYAPVCRRSVSITPLQALNLLNDPVFAEAARALALRTMGQADAFDDRLTHAFLLTVGRPPASEERADLRSFFEKQQRLLQARSGAVQELVPAALTGGQASIEAAAWTTLASVLLNTGEFITRE